MSRRKCLAEGCGRRIKIGRLFCLGHWRQLPAKIRQRIVRPLEIGAQRQAVRDSIRWFAPSERGVSTP